MLDPALAIENLILEEGGYRNVPSDPGGETKFGISRRSYPGLDIKNLTKAAAADIYLRDFWKPQGYGSLRDTLLAYKAFSFSANMGPLRAISFLQRAANEFLGEGLGAERLKVDGALGPKSVAVVNFLTTEIGSAALMVVYLGYVEKHYRACAVKQPDEWNGWMNRLFFVPSFSKDAP